MVSFVVYGESLDDECRLQRGAPLVFREKVGGRLLVRLGAVTADRELVGRYELADCVDRRVHALSP